MKSIRRRLSAAFIALVIFMAEISLCMAAYADKGSDTDSYGGAYAVTGQLAGAGYTTEVYDASNGLPTSDAMFMLSASDGRMWLGGYSGVLRYDGSTF